MRNYSKETLERAKQLRVIDDTLFRLIASRKGVCQEILRTLLDDECLEVIEVTPQQVMNSLERSIVLDALCKMKTGELCNIEMQKSDSNDDIKRVRFHASLITANKTPKGTAFRDIPTVKVLYITEYDALNNNQSVTHISRCQKIGNEYIPVDDGEDIIFANTAVKKNDRYSKLLQLFLKNESFYEKDYPELSEAVKHFKDTEKGRDEMCSIIEEYAVDKAIDATIESFKHCGKTLKETIEYVTSKYETTEAYVTEKYNLSKN